MRLSRAPASGFTLESLGFRGQDLEDIHEALRGRGGLVLVAGPADSGKTTTLYTLLDILNAPSLHLSTIEEAIECRMPRVSQTQARPEIGLTLASGLRALLRQDPDVVMVSDVRDQETLSLALAAASAGKLVFAAVKAPSAAEALSLLLRRGADPVLLSSSLRLVVGQKLLEQPEGGRLGEFRLLKSSPLLKELILKAASAEEFATIK